MKNSSIVTPRQTGCQQADDACAVDDGGYALQSHVRECGKPERRDEQMTNRCRQQPVSRPTARRCLKQKRADDLHGRCWRRPPDR